MKKYAIAVSITAKNVRGALLQIRKANKLADFIELRLDFLHSMKTDDIKSLVGACTKPCICTCRPNFEGGKFRGDENTRRVALENATLAGADFVDVELVAQKSFKKKLINLAHAKKVKVILSKHFFKNTPSVKTLGSLFKKMQAQKPFVIKIVSFARNSTDNERMMDFLAENSHGRIKLIAFCMGGRGEKSRIEALYRGSYLTFAALHKDGKSAAGQMPITTLRKLLAAQKA